MRLASQRFPEGLSLAPLPRLFPGARGNETRRNIAEKIAARQDFNSNYEVNALAMWDLLLRKRWRGLPPRGGRERYLDHQDRVRLRRHLPTADTCLHEHKRGDAPGISEADRTGQPAKVVVSTPWLTTAGTPRTTCTRWGSDSICSPARW